MTDEAQLIDRLRAGEESAFATLVDRYHSPMLQLASTFVPNRAVAEEVVQETWLGVVRGIDRFEGRSSLKTWLFSILVNRARTAGGRERRGRVDSALAHPSVDPQRFGPDGTWSDPPAPWTDDVAERLHDREVGRRLRVAIDQLPHGQREVVLLRDVHGLDSDEVCTMLGITQVNQRVLLHRGRSRLRGMLEREIGNA
ncbi:MAG: RNA polymerase sigma factor [Actinomycetota bacterium]|nr:RNA polymerase sigma factor [Actinomycetota bacterium]